MKKTILVITLILMLSAAVFAQDANDTWGSTFKVGAAGVFGPSPYRGGDPIAMPFPLIMYEKGNFRFFGTQLSYDFYDEDGWVFQGLGQIRLEGYDEDDSRHLKSMGDRDPTFEMGVGLKKDLGFSVFNTTFTNDVLGKHNGYEVRMFFDKRIKHCFNVEGLTTTPSVGVSFRNKNLNNYYYGVRAKEATATRAYYKVSDSVNPFVGVSMTYPLGEKWELFSSANIEFLDDEIRSSPIVDGDYFATFMIGAMYTF
jgi:outer membrane protein